MTALFLYHDIDYEDLMFLVKQCPKLTELLFVIETEHEYLDLNLLFQLIPKELTKLTYLESYVIDSIDLITNSIYFKYIIWLELSCFNNVNTKQLMNICDNFHCLKYLMIVTCNTDDIGLHYIGLKNRQWNKLCINCNNENATIIGITFACNALNKNNAIFDFYLEDEYTNNRTHVNSLCHLYPFINFVYNNQIQKTNNDWIEPYNYSPWDV